MIKQCVICGDDFDGKTTALTCCPEHKRLRKNESGRKYAKLHYASHREYLKKWRKRNIERVRAGDRERRRRNRAENPEKFILHSRMRYWADPKKARAYARKYGRKIRAIARAATELGIT